MKPQIIALLMMASIGANAQSPIIQKAELTKIENQMNLFEFRDQYKSGATLCGVAAAGTCILIALNNPQNDGFLIGLAAATSIGYVIIIDSQKFLGKTRRSRKVDLQNFN